MCTLLVVGVLIGILAIVYSYAVVYEISFEYFAAHSIVESVVIYFLAMNLGKKEKLAIARSQVVK